LHYLSIKEIFLMHYHEDMGMLIFFPRGIPLN